MARTLQRALTGPPGYVADRAGTDPSGYAGAARGGLGRHPGAGLRLSAGTGRRSAIPCAVARPRRCAGIGTGHWDNAVRRLWGDRDRLRCGHGFLRRLAGYAGLRSAAPAPVAASLRPPCGDGPGARLPDRAERLAHAPRLAVGQRLRAPARSADRARHQWLCFDVRSGRQGDALPLADGYRCARPGGRSTAHDPGAHAGLRPDDGLVQGGYAGSLRPGAPAALRRAGLQLVGRRHGADPGPDQSADPTRSDSALGRGSRSGHALYGRCRCAAAALPRRSRDSRLVWPGAAGIADRQIGPGNGPATQS